MHFHRITAFLAIALSAIMPSFAQEITEIAVTTTTSMETLPQMPVATPKVEEEYKVSSHFTWGVDVNCCIDLTTHDMTNIELDGQLGYRHRCVELIGAGGGLMTMLNNSTICFPVYGILRTSFSDRPRLCFLDARGGVSFNKIQGFKQQIDPYASLGLGVRLASGRKFSSHILTRCTFMPLKHVENDAMQRLNYDLWFLSIGLGCAF